MHGTRRTSTKTVGDVMKADVVTVVPEMTVAELVQTFLDEHVRGAPVLGPTGKVIGLVSETDVLRLLLPAPAEGGPDTREAPAAGTAQRHGTAFRRRNPCQLRVGEIMRPVEVVFTPGEPLASVVRSFSRDALQRAVVIENEILLGIVTPADLMPSLAGDA